MNQLSGSADTSPPSPVRPIVPATLALVLGLLLGTILPPAPYPWGAALALALLLGFLHNWRARRIHGPSAPSGLLLLLAVLCLGGALSARLDHNRLQLEKTAPAWVTQTPAVITGRLAEPPRRLGDAFEWVIAVDSIAPVGRPDVAYAPSGARLALFVRDELAAPFLPSPSRISLPLHGQAVVTTLTLRRADAPSDTPSTFKAPAYWRSRDIDWVGSIYEPDRLALAPPPAHLLATVERVLRDVRYAAATTLERRLVPAHAALAKALLLGDTGDLLPATRDTFARAGWAHLLAVSGLHTGFILLLLLFVGRFFRLPTRPLAWFAIVGILTYAALTGFRPPVVRAATMASFVLLAFGLGRYVTPLAGLATAAFFTLILDPLNLYRLDWQFSYACALSIILLAPPMLDAVTALQHRFLPPQPVASATIYWINWTIKHFIWLPIVVSVAIQVALIPLQVHVFRTVNILSILTNWLGILLAFASVFCSLITLIPGLGALIAPITNALFDLLLSLSGAFGHLPYAVIIFERLPAWWLAAYYLCLLSTTALRTPRGERSHLSPAQRLSLLLHLGGCVVLLLWAPALTDFGRRAPLDLYVLDVGQGDSLVARFQDGRIMVIDAGRGHPYDEGERTVAPFLRSLGVGRIDWLVATHADADHIGGMPALMERFEIGALIQGHDISSSAAFERLHQVARSRNIPLLAAEPGAQLNVTAGLDVRLLGPFAGRDDNDASVAVLFDAGPVEFLNTGDLESGGERELVTSFELPDIEVLKVGHHGSRSSSTPELLNEVRPEIAIVSVGARNTYGHPATEVLDRFGALGTALYRTDRHGTLWVRIDGSRATIYQYAGP